MIAFASLLVKPAQEAGIQVPEDPETYDPHQFMRWHVYCLWQLGRPLAGWTSHWDNARAVAAIPAAELDGLKVVRDAVALCAVNGCV